MEKFVKDVEKSTMQIRKELFMEIKLHLFLIKIRLKLLLNVTHIYNQYNFFI